MASLVSSQLNARLGRHVAARPQRRAMHIVPRAMTVTDPDTKVDFPLAQDFWTGSTMRCLGAGVKVKKILMLNVQVYSAAGYVEADKCAKELGVRSRGGFFESDDDYMTAVMDGAFDKVVVVHLVRDVDGETFAKALNDTLVPRMQLAGEMDKLSQFVDHLKTKNLSKDTEVVMLWNVASSTLETIVVPPGGEGPSGYSKATPEVKVESLAMCRSLFEVFMGAASSAPIAKEAWVKGAKNLLESDNVKRNLA